jgi:FkbM family methyltransferase
MRLIRLVVAVALVAGSLVETETVAVAAPAWSVSASPSPLGPVTGLATAVSCPTATTCFAVGQYDSGSMHPSLIERWNGTNWSVVPNPNPDGATATRLIDIDCISLDEYFGGLGWPRVDLVKMDVEGQELPTLRGMEELARRNPEMRIIFEFNAGQLKRCGVRAEDLFSQVRRMGYPNYFILFRESVPFSLPADWSRLQQAAKRANVNILATR